MINSITIHFAVAPVGLIAMLAELRAHFQRVGFTRRAPRRIENLDRLHIEFMDGEDVTFAWSIVQKYTH